MSAVGAATGGLFTAIFLRHNTSTEEFEKVKAAKFKEVADELLASGRMTFTEYYKANNFLKVAKKADAFYADNPQKTNSNTFDFDWFVRFFEAVGNVSDEKIQDIWAKILAGEIAQPSKFSLKTIDTLRNISKRDAELFTKICKYSFISEHKRVFLPRNDKYLEKNQINYIDIMKLSELGLIFNSGTIGINMTINPDQRVLLINNELIMTVASSSGKEEEASFGQYLFTDVGTELSTIISNTPDDKDFIEYGKQLSIEHKNLNIAIYKMLKYGDIIEHDNKNLIDVIDEDTKD